ncbi:hypothetical protein JHK87_042054 [Glycine soja]|nr:hypothetical protein JHK87_042054 [Glycine soja]
MKCTGELEKIVRKAALIIAVSWLLLVAFIVVSANADNTKIHPPTSKNMVCCWFIWKSMIKCGKVCCEDGCCS